MRENLSVAMRHACLLRSRLLPRSTRESIVHQIMVASLELGLSQVLCHLALHVAARHWGTVVKVTRHKRV